MSTSDFNATTMLTRVCHHEPGAREALFQLVYDDLKALAARLFRAQPAGHTLQPTAIVHEAYLRLIDRDHTDWKGRAHFFGVAAKAMRHLLVDHARGRATAKRGGGWKRITLAGEATLREQQLLILDDALQALAELDPRKAQVVELRFFGGLSVEEIAEALGVGKTAIGEDWRFARAWLSKAISEDDRSTTEA